MAEYIEREALKQKIVDEQTENHMSNHPAAYKVGYHNGLTMAMAMVLTAPAADVVPVVHGRWVDHMVRDWRCSECGEKIHKVRNVDGYCYDDKPNYCPNCGAYMKDGE